MITFLEKIRTPNSPQSVSRQFLHTVLILLLGAILGIFSKYLDCTPSNEQLRILEMLDMRNFLGRLSVWIFLASVVSIYSRSPIRAGINVFCFFTGMLTGYYAYTHLIAGFFPGNYVMIWAVITVLSPVPAFFCWYAKGRGLMAWVVSAAIAGVLFWQAFGFGIFYFYVKYPLEVLVWFLGMAVLYQSPKQMAAVFGISILFAAALKGILPFAFG